MLISNSEVSIFFMLIFTYIFILLLLMAFETVNAIEKVLNFVRIF